MSSEDERRDAALVVDDDGSSRSVLRHLLEIDGWRVREARDGREALRSLRDVDPDLVMTDIEMPVMDGVELAAELRRRLGRRVPLVAVSRRPPTGPARDLFDCVLEKPVSPSEVRACLDRL